MSVYDPTQIIPSLGGRLVIGPSQGGMSTGTYPFGGTEVGIVSKARFVREQAYAFSKSECLGRDKLSAYGGRHSAAFSCELVQFDVTILRKLYAVLTGSFSGYPGGQILSLPGLSRTLLPGLVTQGPSPLLFAADDYVSKPSLIIYAPLFILPPKIEWDMALGKPVVTEFTVVAANDASNRDFAFDLIGNLFI